MAKQQRMALMTGACGVQAALVFLPWRLELVRVALGIIVAGCVVTMVRRCTRIVRVLEKS